MPKQRRLIFLGVLACLHSTQSWRRLVIASIESCNDSLNRITRHVQHIVRSLHIMTTIIIASIERFVESHHSAHAAHSATGQPTALSPSLSVSVSVSLSLCLSVTLSMSVSQSVSLSFCLSLSHSHIQYQPEPESGGFQKCIYLYLYLYQSIYLSIYLSI